MKRFRVPRAAWLPISVALISVSATLLLWHALRKQEQAQVERVVKLATYSIRADMIADMNLRIRGLVDLSKMWQLNEPPRNEFDMRATMYISHVPGCVAVGWVDAGSAVKWVVPVDGDTYVRDLLAAAGPERNEALQRSMQNRGPVVSNTVQSLQEINLLPVWVPVFREDRFTGFLIGVYRVQTLLDDVLSDHADLGYEVNVSDRHGEFYSLASGAIPRNKWAQNAAIPLPGNDWTIRIWPGPKVLPDTLPLSRVVLLGGMVVALQLTLTVYLAQKARLWAREVEAANQELVKENNERRHAEESLHRLSGRLIELQDEERRRLSRELHDSTAQTLYGLSIKLKLLARTLPADSEGNRVLYEGMELADQCIREVRTVSYLLHPPSLDELGLVAAWRSLVDGFTERSGIKVDLQVPPQLGRLRRDIETALFRVVQESLSNIHRHSGSKSAAIRLSRENGMIMLEINDEGHGFRTEDLDGEPMNGAALGVGVAGMRERLRQLGGRLELQSSPDGTRVVAVVPLRMEVAAREQLGEPATERFPQAS